MPRDAGSRAGTTITVGYYYLYVISYPDFKLTKGSGIQMLAGWRRARLRVSGSRRGQLKPVELSGRAHQ